MRRLNTCVFFVFQVASVCLCNELDVVSNAVNLLQSGNTAGLNVQRFTNAGESAVAFLRSAKALPDDESRTRVVYFARALIQQARKRSGRECEKDLAACADEMVRLAIGDQSERVRGAAVHALLDVVPASIVNHHGAEIRRAAETRKEIDLVLLYASLEDCDKRNVVDMVRGMKSDSVRDRHKLDGIMARCGDDAAMKRVMAAWNSLEDTNATLLSDIVSATAFAATNPVKAFLAAGLRSEDMVSLAGGGEIPKRNCYARALVVMHRNDATFPVRTEDYFYSDDDLDRIEKWCAEKAGVKVGSGPRRRLTVQPGVE